METPRKLKSTDQGDEKPSVLKKPRSVMRFLMILIALFVLVYAAVAATAFLRTQSQDPSGPPPQPVIEEPANA